MGLITMSGCSEDSIFEEPFLKQEISVSTNSNSETRSLLEVLKIAEVSRRKTRAGLLPEKIIPIIDQLDTVAYIINYVGNRGFAIISANKKVYCHWGWNGSCDGYYKKDLFEPIPGYKYSAGSNFYVKIDKYQLE